MNPDDYGIVVGIDTYPALRPLRSATRDAAHFAEWLESPTGGGIPPEKGHVRLIVSKSTFSADYWDATPVQHDIDRALRDFGAAARKRVGRRLYFYFAGHGIGLAFDDVGMLMANASMETLNSNIGLRPYLGYLHDTVLFDEVVFILDCCRDSVRSEGTRGPAFGGARGTGAALAAGATAAPAPPAAQVESLVILAAEYGARAFDRNDPATGERRGVLTQAVLEALKGTAAADATGRITAASLGEYVLRRVPEIGKLPPPDPPDPKLAQKPRIERVPNRDLVFRTVTDAELPRVKVRVIAADGLTGELVVRTGTGSIEIDRRQAAAAIQAAPPWELDLIRNSKYLVEHPDSDTLEVLDPKRLTDNVYRFPPP
jgi:hypothetical protein